VPLLPEATSTELSAINHTDSNWKLIMSSGPTLAEIDALQLIYLANKTGL
jgi:hypothetical protein